MHSIASQRLHNQFLARPLAGTAADLVAWMGAVQAQEYDHARWGLGLRLAGEPSAAAIEHEIAAGRIVRTHVLRPTWHFVAANDFFWMQALTAPRVRQRMAPYNRHLDLDDRTLRRATGLIERALGDEAARGRGALTRAELGQVLRRARITVTPMRMAHIAMHAELEGVICSGPRRERQFTYALAANRARRHLPIDRDKSLGELATRYFQSHGPATIRDFVWWSGLATPDAVRASEIARASSRIVDGRTYFTIGGRPFASSVSYASSRSRTRRQPHVHLLPIYDEYFVAYKDRFAVPNARTAIVTNGRVVGFMHALVIDGQVAGTWRTTRGRPGDVDLAPLRRLSAPERRGIEIVRQRYARFAG
jgi:hypothetical protein